MAGTPQGMSRYFVLASLCLSLAIPIDLHGTIVEFGAHDVQGAVSVAARHAGHEAHFEHSAVELRSHCVACVLTPKSDRPPLLPAVRQQRMPQVGRLELHDPPSLEPRSDHHAPSRAPPLL